MGINLDGILESLGIKGKFDEKAEAAYTKAKEAADDESIFESKDKFIEHYSDEIFGGSDVKSMAIDDFVKQAEESGFVEKEDAGKFKVAIDANRDGKFSRDEAGELIATVYDSAQARTQENKPDELNNASADTKEDRPELYENVTVQPWGTGEDDCLSRIIQKHVDGVKLYSEDYNQFVEETCKLNDIKDPNIISGDIKLPELKRGEDGTPLKDADGKLQFYSEDELKALKDNSAAPEPALIQNTDGTYTRETKDAAGNVIKVEFLNSNEDNAEPTSTIDFKYENGKKTGFEQNSADGLNVVGKYDTKGRVISEVTTMPNKQVIYDNYEYNEDGTGKKITTMNGGYLAQTQLDKDGREISSTVNDFASGETQEISYTYNDDGTKTTSIKSSNNYTTTIITDNNDVRLYEKTDFGNDVWTEQIFEDGKEVKRTQKKTDGSTLESIFKDGKETERTEIKSDNSKTYVKTTENNIMEYEKTDPEGNVTESGKKDQIGIIKDVQILDGGRTSSRTYENGSTAEWTDKGTKIASVYVKDPNGKNVSITGEKFVEWLTDDIMVKGALIKWINEQSKLPTNNEILEKSKEIKATEKLEYA